MKDKIVSTDCGLVRGKRNGAGYAFLGIPFGRAERFCPPEPVTWEGVRDCLEYAPAAPQPDRQGAWPEGVPFSWNGSEEEGLNLNIWTKSVEKDANLPVVIYIYGGAFQVGSNSMPSRAGDLFMEDREMVFVAVNYRVGVLGFLEMGEIEPSLRGSGNNGIRDLLLAIDWVHRNIRSFGGSPERITLFGISAGAKSIASLLTLPQIQECCSQVVLESGAMQAFRTEHTAQAVARDFLHCLPADISPRDLELGELLRCQAEFCGRAGATCFFGPVLTEPFAKDWEQRWESGESWRGSALIGCGAQEMLNTVRNPEFKENPGQVVADLFGDHASLAMYKKEELCEAGVAEEEAWTRVLSDFMYRYYSDGLARKLADEGNPVWCYSFEYAPAVHGRGFHFMMNEWDAPQGTEPEEAERLTAFMRRNVRAFLCDGAPEEKSWRPYEGKHKMIFTSEPHMEERPEDTLTGFPVQVYTRG